VGAITMIVYEFLDALFAEVTNTTITGEKELASVM
jgi:hypothetical protein